MEGITPRVLALAALTMLAACGREDAGSASDRVLAAADSVVLQEGDGAFIGSAGHLAAGPDGTVFVSDAMNAVVLRFGRDGRLVGSYGGRGSGPGEMETPVAAAVAGDSLLVVSDWGHSRLHVFSLATGRRVASVRHEGYPFTMAIHGDTVVTGVVNAGRGTALGAWPMFGGDVRYFAPLPAPYRASRHLAETMPYATAALLGDTVLFGLAADGDLFLVGMDGTLLDTVRVPAERRRGVPADVVRRFAADPDNAEIAAMVSVPVALHRLSDGRIAVLHQDLSVEGQTLTAQPFLSILSADRRTACADLPLPPATEGRPVAAFAGDTLLSLETRLRGGTRAEHVLVRYDLGGFRCEMRRVR
jgi:hypothetical protein